MASGKPRKGAMTKARKPVAGRHPEQKGIDRDLVYTALRFGGYFAAMSFVVLALLPLDFIEWLQLITTDVAAALMLLVGLPLTREGILIHLPEATLQIDLGCTAIVIIGVYASLILAYKASAVERLIGIVAGTAFILVINQIRLVATGLALQYAPSAFGLLHDYLYQVVMVAVVLAAWAVWLRWLAGRADAADTNDGSAGGR